MRKGEAIESEKQTVETFLDSPNLDFFEIKPLASEISTDSEQDISEIAEISDPIIQSRHFESTNDLKLIITENYIETKITHLLQNKWKVIFKIFHPSKTLDKNNKVLILVCTNCIYQENQKLRKEISNFFENYFSDFQNYKIIDFNMHHVFNRRGLLYEYEKGIVTSLPTFLNAIEFEKNSSEVLKINSHIESFKQFKNYLKTNYGIWLDNFFDSFHNQKTPVSNSICEQLKLVIYEAIEYQVEELEDQFDFWKISEKEIFLILCFDRFIEDIKNIIKTLKNETDRHPVLNPIKYSKKNFIKKRNTYNTIILCFELLMFNYQESIPLKNTFFWSPVTIIFYSLLNSFNQWNYSNSKFFGIDPVNLCPECKELKEYLIKFDKGILCSKKNLKKVKILFETEFIKKKVKDEQGCNTENFLSIANTLHEPFPQYRRLELFCKAIITIDVFKSLCPNLELYLKNL